MNKREHVETNIVVWEPWGPTLYVCRARKYKWVDMEIVGRDSGTKNMSFSAIFKNCTFTFFILEDNTPPLFPRSSLSRCMKSPCYAHHKFYEFYIFIHNLRKIVYRKHNMYNCTCTWSFVHGVLLANNTLLCGPGLKY